MNIGQVIRTRYAGKFYDETRKLTAEQEQQLFDLLRYSPSSVNSQPWHFFTLCSDAAKQKILPAVREPNKKKIQQSAMVVVFATHTEITDAHLQAILTQEKKNGRFSSQELEVNQDKGRRYFVSLYSGSQQQQREWMARQAYISLGFLLLGAAAMGLDATPIEGFFADKMDDVLGLQEKGLTSVVIAAVGYRNEDDLNTKLPKSRLAQEHVITRL